MLKKTDIKGDLISDWCIAGVKPEEGRYVVCNSTINCSEHGITVVTRHAKSKTHQNGCQNHRNKVTGRLKKISQPVINFDEKYGQEMSHSDKVIHAEALFAIAVAKKNIFHFHLVILQQRYYLRYLAIPKLPVTFQCPG